MKKFMSILLAVVMVFSMSTVAFAANEDYNWTGEDNHDAPIVITNKDGDDNADITADDNQYNIGVQAGINTGNIDPDNAAKNYYVVVEWDVTSTLTYTLDNDAYSWTVYSDENHTTEATTGKAASAGYVTDYTKGSWGGQATVNVTITNWSNAAIDYEIGFVAPTTSPVAEAPLTVDSSKITVTNGDVVGQIGQGTVASAAKEGMTEGQYVTAADVAKAELVVAIGEGAISGAIMADDTSVGTVTVKILSINNTDGE